MSLTKSTITTKQMKHKNRVIHPHEMTMLLDIYDGRMTTIDAASRLYYNSPDTAQDRLLKLSKVGLLVKQAQNVSYVNDDGEIKSKEINLYLLSKAGFDFLIEHGHLKAGQEPLWETVRKRFNIANPDHELAILQIKSLLVPALNQVSGLRVLSFRIRPDSIKFAVPEPGRSTPFTQYPDGFFELATHQPLKDEPARVYRYYLEMDRGGETHETLLGKAQRYFKHAQPEQNFQVLYVFLSKQRLFNFCQKLVEQNPNRNLEMMTTLAEINNNPLGDIWITPQNFRRAQNRDSIIQFSLIPELKPEVGI